MISDPVTAAVGAFHIILGTNPAGETLTGTAVADHITGLGGNDVFEVVPPLSPHFAVNIYSGVGHDQVVRPKTAAAGIQNLTWFTRPGPGIPPTKGLPLEADPHAELTSDSNAWLGRYNLND